VSFKFASREDDCGVRMTMDARASAVGDDVVAKPLRNLTLDYRRQNSASVRDGAGEWRR